MENLTEILALQKQVGILIGAGVSRACELPDVASLTNEIRKKISNDNFIAILDPTDNVELILNKLAQLKQLIPPGKEISGLTLEDVQKLEEDIKKSIYEQLSKETDHSKLCSLVTWLNYINNDFEKEIFTLNYDLMLERALEDVGLPYFTGFVGTVKPFFIPESVDDFSGEYVKKNWTKLWKMHGSLNYKKTRDGKIFIESKVIDEYENLLIYPSMDKYLSSRKAPFISYLDRFRKYILNSEKILFILGYSFSDEHVNEIINNGLSNNTHLSVIVFAYDDSTYNKCKGLFGIYPNLSIYTSNRKYLNRNESELKCANNIGDFSNFVKLLDTFLQPRQADSQGN